MQFEVSKDVDQMLAITFNGRAVLVLHVVRRLQPLTVATARHCHACFN